MVRNLYSVNSFPFFPTRFWQKRTGPFESSLMAIAINTRTGKLASRPNNDKSNEKACLSNRNLRDACEDEENSSHPRRSEPPTRSQTARSSAGARRQKARTVHPGKGGHPWQNRSSTRPRSQRYTVPARVAFAL